jgi:hypothetical protein
VNNYAPELDDRYPVIDDPDNWCSCDAEYRDPKCPQHPYLLPGDFNRPLGEPVPPIHVSDTFSLDVQEAAFHICIAIYDLGSREDDDNG